MQKFQLSGDNLTVELAKKIAEGEYEISLSPRAKQRVESSRKVVEKWVRENKPVIGITTGIGEFRETIIPIKDMGKVQRNLIFSYCTAIGDPLPRDIVRLMLLLRINSFAKGYSGVRIELVEWLIRLFNLNIVPYIPSHGSVGTSGDIVPLAHMTAPVIGEGFVLDEHGKAKRTKSILRKNNIGPLELSAKEGLAMITGTQMMTAYSVEIADRAARVLKLADIAGALTIEALGSSQKAFDGEFQIVRPHKGQIRSASNLRKLLKDGELKLQFAENQKSKDSYSISCMPQVHGAVKDIIYYTYEVINTEINSATDNPLVFPETGEYIEGGNFHGEPISLALDYLKIALNELGIISERRIVRIVESSLSGVPKFLAHHGKMDSGLMLEQYTAASLVSENKNLCQPVAIDSIPPGSGHEDYNSLGSISSRRCLELLGNVEKIIAIEMHCSSQAIDFLKTAKCGKGTLAAYKYIRKKIPFVEYDVNLNQYIKEFSDSIFCDEFIHFVESKAGKLE